MKLRQGRKVGRTIYRQNGDQPSDDDTLIGVMDTPYLAALIVEAANDRYTPKPHTYTPVPNEWGWAVNTQRGWPCAHLVPWPAIEIDGTEHCRRPETDPIHQTEPDHA